MGINFCKHPPKEITAGNVFNYTNLDFTSDLWPITGHEFYDNPHVIKHICNNVIDIHAKPKKSSCCLISKILCVDRTSVKVNLEYVINSGYYLRKYISLAFVAVNNKPLIWQYRNKYMGHQQYIKELVIGNPNYYPKNIINYNYMLVILLWLMKYQKMVPNVLVKHKIIPFVYS